MKLGLGTFENASFLLTRVPIIPFLVACAVLLAALDWSAINPPTTIPLDRSTCFELLKANRGVQ